MKLIPFILFHFILSGDQNHPIKEYPVMSPERLILTREYIKEHYGIDSHLLEKPKIIIIHYTGIRTLGGSLNYFRPAMIWEDRGYIKKFGRVNVGVHYVVHTNGDIYSLLPVTVMGRHAIGFNHVALGIENVAADAGGLTRAQALSNARLVSLLVNRHPSIEFLAGHHEYTDRNLPHCIYYMQKNKDYAPTVKIDPGREFMEGLRRNLKEKYDIILKK